MTLPQLTELLGWVAILNFGFLLLMLLILTTMKESCLSIHSKMFGMSEQELNRAYFHYLAQYKIVVLVFNIVPWLALKIMGQ